MGNPNVIDMGGLTLIANSIKTGATAPGFDGTEVTLDNAAVTAGDEITLGEGKNINVGTSTGTKVGAATSQKIGFWNATPVIQQASASQAAVTPSTDFSGSDTVDKAVVLAAVQAVETLVNRLRLDLVTTGMIKGSA